jgi:hypothetical protein
MGKLRHDLKFTVVDVYPRSCYKKRSQTNRVPPLRAPAPKPTTAPT